MKELTMLQQLFVCELIVDWNATAALERCRPVYEGKFTGSDAARMLKIPGVAAEIAKCRAQIVDTVQLTVKMVVQDIINVLEADPNELVDVVTVACRHCHGDGHLYQRTQNEYNSDAMRLGDKFSHLGGTGFNPYRGPHPDCPECFGEGEQRERVKDTRFLSPAARSLYIGAERTKHGLKINMRSKDAARQQAALYLGMNKETLKLQKTKAAEMTDDELAALAKGESE